jgi:hypothetical protein
MGYIGNQSSEAYSSVDKQVITGNGGTAYTLSHSVANANEIEVFVNNVRQEPGIAYTVSAGTSLAMTGNVESTDDFYVVFQGKAVQTATHPSDAPLTASQINADNLRLDGNTISSTDTNGDITLDPNGTGDTVMTGSGGQVTVDENGHITSKQSLDVATAGGRIIGASNRGTVSQIDLAQTTSSADGGYIRFLTCNSGSTNPTERMRLLSGGGLTFNGDTAAANALDDYEEGTFTPVFQQGLTSAGYSTQIGTYIKIGRQVICSIQLRATSGTENNSHIYVGGLPFTITNDVDHSFGAFWTYNGGFWTSSANTSFLGLRNQTNLAFYKQVDGGSIVGTNSNVAANLNADLRIVVVYRAD